MLYQRATQNRRQDPRFSKVVIINSMATDSHLLAMIDEQFKNNYRKKCRMQFYKITILGTYANQNHLKYLRDQTGSNLTAQTFKMLRKSRCLESLIMIGEKRTSKRAATGKFSKLIFLELLNKIIHRQGMMCSRNIHKLIKFNQTKDQQYTLIIKFSSHPLRY